MNDFSSIEGLIELNEAGDGRWKTGIEGVIKILSPKDAKVEFILFEKFTLAYVKSALGSPAIYPVEDVCFQAPAEAILMDLDGTSVHSEEFWIWTIEQAVARLLDKKSFLLEETDLPFVSGHSVSEHLQYCIDKYCPDKKVELARKIYFDITSIELDKILKGCGHNDAFSPAPGLKDFLLTIKSNNIKIALVTSGLYEKAWPEIVSAFRTLNMGDPLKFYDAIITAGSAVRKGQAGTLGELSPKPHPWLYAETARVGLGIPTEKRSRVIGIEDSSAGVVSLRLAGFAAIGLAGGNIKTSGAEPLLFAKCHTLADALDIILG